MCFKSVKCFAVINYILLHTLINYCASKRFCDEYLKDNQYTICTRSDKDNRVRLYMENNSSKLTLNCHNEHFGNYPPNSRDALFVDCTFEGLDQTSSESTSRYENMDAILKNDTFKNLCYVTAISFANANIELIDADAFRCLQKLHSLNLFGNRIAVLDPGVFKGIKYLYYLNLSYNRLRKLPEGIFHPIEELTTLSLEGNSLETLGHLPFLNLTRLSRLILQNNRLKGLENVFLNNPQLARLESSNNYISAISSDVFRETENLELVDLSGNQLEQITPEVFGVLRKLKTLNVAFNRIDELVEESFRNNSAIENLDLQGNELAEIRNNDFVGLMSLHTLNLASNAIETIATECFQNLSSLTYLNMESNRLRFLNRSSPYHSLFSDKKLRNLNLSGNRLQNLSNAFGNSSVYNLDLSSNVGLILSDNTFAGLRDLRVLRMEGCHITFIPDHIFANVPKLTQIHMRNNSIIKIKPVTFASLKRISTLDLSYNRIANLSDDLFVKNALLRLLNLSSNNIGVVGKEAFRGLNSAIWLLDISSNTIQEFQITDVILGILNISHNRISSLGCLIEVKGLIYLDVSHNNLSRITKQEWSKIVILQTFMAMNNSIEEVLIQEINQPKGNSSIHLEHNKINRILLPAKKEMQLAEDTADSSGSSFRASLNFYLTGNFIKCDCFAYAIHNYVNNHDYSKHYIKFIDDLMCQSPLEQRARKLKELKPADFTCSFADDPSNFQCSLDCICIQNCTCLYRPADELRSVNCSNKGYRSLPSNIPDRTNLLDMNQNNLSSLAELRVPEWDYLKEIYAESNAIDSADFRIPENVTYLGLKHNSLRNFPASIARHAENIKGFKLTVSENPWTCDCSVMPLKKFFSGNINKVTDSNNVNCAFQNGSLAVLKTLKDVELCPLIRNPAKTAMLNALSALAILASVSTIAFYYSNKQYILSFFYTNCNGCYRLFCCNRPIEDSKLFDGFISYSSEDRDVTLAIVEELEQKPPNYHFCIHERNWLAGSYITNNILRSVQDSRKTLVILSKKFLESEWFQLEFQAAFHQTLKDKKDRIILIVKGDLPDKSLLHEDVRYVLSTKTYLEWGEEWFFEKLRYALMEEQKPVVQEEKQGRLVNALSSFRRWKRNAQNDVELCTRKNLVKDVELCTGKH